MFRELIVVLLTLDTVSAECYYLEVKHAYNFEVNGVYYIYDYDMQCDGRNIYRHLDRELYLYHIDGWWVVHNEFCVEEGIVQGRVRGHDSSLRPELIIEIWEERIEDHWRINALFDVDCFYGPGALPTIAIICITIACFLVAVAIISLPIVLCLRDSDSSGSSTPQPVPQQETMTVLEVIPTSRDQPPPYDSVPTETVVLTSNVESVK